MYITIMLSLYDVPKKYMKITRWEEKLFNVLVDPVEESIDEQNF